MRVACSQEQLQRALGRVGRAVSTRSTLNVLGNVLLATEQGRLRIAATNLEIGVTTWIEADIETEGKITIEARLLTEFVNSLEAGAVSLETDDVRTAMTVKSGRVKATINGITPEDFPELPSLSDGGFTFDVDAQGLRETINLVEFSAATDETRPVLAGVMMRLQDDVMTLASADGFRMAVAERTLDAPVKERQELIIPARSLRELSRLIGDVTETIQLAITPNRSQILARVEDTEWVSRLIDGTFPDVKQIVPKSFQTRVEIGRDSLMSAVRRAGYFARENNDVVFLNIQPGEDNLTPGSVEISAVAAERGNSESVVDASITGNEVRVAFNSHYVNDVLNVLRSGQVTVGLNGTNTAGVIRPAGSESSSHVIMPMVIGA